MDEKQCTVRFAKNEYYDIYNALRHQALFGYGEIDPEYAEYLLDLAQRINIVVFGGYL